MGKCSVILRFNGSLTTALLVNTAKRSHPRRCRGLSQVMRASNDSERVPVPTWEVMAFMRWRLERSSTAANRQHGRCRPRDGILRARLVEEIAARFDLAT